MKAAPSRIPEADRVLGKATWRAAEFLGLKGSELAEVIGVSEAMVSRVRSGERGLSPTAKEGQLALLLVRIFRSLDAQVGNNDRHRQAWVNTHNRALDGIPRDLLRQPTGLVNVLQYLDGLRSPL